MIDIIIDKSETERIIRQTEEMEKRNKEIMAKLSKDIRRSTKIAILLNEAIGEAIDENYELCLKVALKMGKIATEVMEILKDE